MSLAYVYDAEPTQRVDALPTQDLQLGAIPLDVPQWAVNVEEAIRVLARLGCSPTPSLLAVGTLVVSIALRHG